MQLCIAFDIHFQIQNVYIWQKFGSCIHHTPQEKQPPSTTSPTYMFVTTLPERLVLSFLDILHHTKRVAVKFVFDDNLSGRRDLSCSMKHHMTPSLVTKVILLWNDWWGMTTNGVGHTKSEGLVFVFYRGEMYTSY